jgi:hypothetical protein
MPRPILLPLALLLAAAAPAPITHAGLNSKTLILHTSRYGLTRTAKTISWKEHLSAAGKPTGGSRVTCTAATPTLLHCKGTYILATGTLHATATASQSTGKGKITGGTLAYTHATGTIKIVQLNDNGDSRITIALR